MMARLWQRRAVRIAVYIQFTLVVFLLSLVATYPSDALVAEVEAAVAKSGALKSFSAREARISGLGVRLRGVALVSASGDAKLPWLIEDLWVGLKGFSFDTKAPAFRFAVSIYEGEISGSYDSGALQLAIRGIALGTAQPLQRLVKVGLSGRADGVVDVKLGKKGIRQLSGEANLKITDTSIGPGELPIPGFGAPLSLPRASIGDLPLEMVIDKGAIELKPLKVVGGDIEIAAKGKVKFVGAVAATRLDLQFDLHATDRLKATQEGKNLLTALDPKSPLLPSRIKRSFSKKGWLGISLAGRFSRPRFQVRKSHVR